MPHIDTCRYLSSTGPPARAGPMPHNNAVVTAPAKWVRRYSEERRHRRPDLGLEPQGRYAHPGLPQRRS